ncbi:hypothetical protein ACRE_018250 [Hapsidospora chrysogenum ATCC 11550]|uniref:Uncharacterized protein n=1 Tax=Hapsidospora chrysogenum (strain ATCC 11550 / CBS 779.69 / DSM 880 / IAM 14645 / JCM 23072 / IMI 49137) TaxID=857340 RepID=A0A086TDC9_HAPC1|nr:hypothetical protein ACRE_018250 [Hapsidospora chrysogenum ATCC 11550]
MLIVSSSGQRLYGTGDLLSGNTNPPPASVAQFHRAIDGILGESHMMSRWASEASLENSTTVSEVVISDQAPNPDALNAILRYMYSVSMKLRVSNGRMFGLMATFCFTAVSTVSPL